MLAPQPWSACGRNALTYHQELTRMMHPILLFADRTLRPLIGFSLARGACHRAKVRSPILCCAYSLFGAPFCRGCFVSGATNTVGTDIAGRLVCVCWNNIRLMLARQSPQIPKLHKSITRNLVLVVTNQYESNLHRPLPIHPIQPRQQIMYR